jgi:D-alanyl-D-alanine carboxypeptidase
MKKYICLCLSLLCLFSLGVSADKPYSTAQSAILWDADSNRMLFSQNENQRLPMASTTKIMTAIIALEQGDLDSMVTIPKEAVGIEGSSCYFQEGEKLTLRSLLYCLLLQSANDAAHAIAVHIAGSVSAFAVLMNLKAAELALLDTHFENPHGLDSDCHYTTAKDLARLADYCMQNPVFCEIWGTKTISLPLNKNEELVYCRALSNHNRLLRLYPLCVGGKTGFTKRCGRCLVSAAKRDGHTLIAVTLNCPTDWADHQRMYQYGFSTLLSEHKESSSWKKFVYKSISPIAD